MPERQEKYYLYKVPTDTTLTALIAEKGSVIGYYKGKVSDLLTVTFKGAYNNDRIYNNYTIEQQQDPTIKNRYQNKALDVVNAGTTIAIPEDKIPIELFSIAGKGIFLEQSNIKAFLTEAFKTINNDPANIPVVSYTNANYQAQLIGAYMTVWVYVKSLDKILDVTKFVSNLNTNSSVEGGGGFSFQLEGIANLDNSFLQGEEIINLVDISHNPAMIQMSYWARYFQQKDIVWIRWEYLELEDNRDLLIDSFEVNKQNLKGQIYDMIGLVENVEEHTNFSSLDREVSVSGRDLTLLLQEDAAYFYPLMFTTGSDCIMINTTDDSKLYKRNVYNNGIYESFFTFEQRKIKDSIGFILNQLTNLGIVDNESQLFSSYAVDDDMEGSRLGVRRSQKQTLAITGSGDDNSAYVQWQEVNGIWQIIDIFVDKTLDKRTQVDSLLQTAHGTIMSMMNSICQQPFVEFFGDTYGDKYVFFARQKIFTKTAIQDFINSNFIIEISPNDILSQTLSWETEFYTSYEVQPNSSYLGYDNYTNLSYIPVVFLSRIGELFGNRPYQQADSYIDESALTGTKQETIQKDQIEPFRNAVIDDLLYLIGIHSYLPFTRRGSITINGDRRIKKGTWIYFTPTKEYYYVTGVSNSGSFTKNTIDRTTTLTVERGMVKDYIFGLNKRTDDGSIVNMSYFNIVDMNVLETNLKETLVNGSIVSQDQLSQGNSVVQEKTTTKKKSTFDVNMDVFNFFMWRRQFTGLGQQDIDDEINIA